MMATTSAFQMVMLLSASMFPPLRQTRPAPVLVRIDDVGPAAFTGVISLFRLPGSATMTILRTKSSQ